VAPQARQANPAGGWPPQFAHRVVSCQRFQDVEPVGPVVVLSEKAGAVRGGGGPAQPVGERAQDA